METKVDAKNIMLKFGGLLGLGLVILQLIPYLTGNIYKTDSLLVVLSGYIGYGLIIVCVVWAMRTFRKENEGFLNFGKGLKIGMGTVAIGTLTIVVYTIIFMKYIEPNFAQEMLEVQMEKILNENPQMTQEELDMAKNIAHKVSGTWMAATFLFIWFLFIGFVISLISAAVLQRKKAELNFEE